MAQNGGRIPHALEAVGKAGVAFPPYLYPRGRLGAERTPEAA